MREKMPAFGQASSFKPLFLLLLLTCAAFANILTHDFCGDDHTVIVRNTFYSSLSNLPRLFTRSYFTVGNTAIFKDEPDKGSGSVAYRPVLSLTYFMDHALWGKNPFGYHLTNLLLHLANVALVYFFLSSFFRNQLVVFWAALLFAIHPVQSEAVTSVGFRADPLAAFWCLLAVCTWLLYQREQKIRYRNLSLVFFVLALLTKESSFLLFVWIACMEHLHGASARNIMRRVMPFFLLAAGYLVVYFVLLPNTALGNDIMHGLSFSRRLSALSQIWFNYFLFFVWPPAVKPLPGLYYPFPAPIFLTLEFWLLLFVLGAGLFLVWRRSTRDEPYMFMLLWFFIFFLPACGLAGNPNPAGLRYLYLPGVGIYCCLAGGIARLMRSSFALRLTVYWPRFLGTAIISCCLIFLVFNTMIWRNNMSMGRFWVDELPDFYKGHYIYANELYVRGAYLEAIEHYQEALKDPRADRMMLLNYFARTCLSVGKFEAARALFEELVKLAPGYASGYEGLARYYFSQKNFDKCRQYLRQSVGIEPTKDNYLLLMDLAVATKDQLALLKTIDEIPVAFASNPPYRDFLLEAARQRLGEFE